MTDLLSGGGDVAQTEEVDVDRRRIHVDGHGAGTEGDDAGHDRDDLVRWVPQPMGDHPGPDVGVSSQDLARHEDVGAHELSHHVGGQSHGARGAHPDVTGRTSTRGEGDEHRARDGDTAEDVGEAELAPGEQPQRDQGRDAA